MMYLPSNLFITDHNQPDETRECQRKRDQVQLSLISLTAAPSANVIVFFFTQLDSFSLHLSIVLYFANCLAQQCISLYIITCFCIQRKNPKIPVLPSIYRSSSPFPVKDTKYKSIFWYYAQVSFYCATYSIKISLRFRWFHCHGPSESKRIFVLRRILPLGPSLLLIR